MLQHDRRQGSRPRRARKRDLTSSRGQVGTGLRTRDDLTGLERRGGGDKESDNNGNNDAKINRDDKGNGNNQGNNNSNNSNNNNNNKGNDNNKGSPDSKSKDDQSSTSIVATSSTPPPPPPPSTSLVVASTTSTLLTTATLTTIAQSSSSVQTTPLLLTAATSSSSLIETSSSSPLSLTTSSATETALPSSTDVSTTTTSSQITTPAASPASSTSGSQVLATAEMPTDAASITKSPSAQESKPSGLSKGAQAGIAIGVISFVVLLVVGIILLVKRRRQRHTQSSLVRAPTPEMTSTLVRGPAELDGSEARGFNGRSTRRSNISLSSSTWTPSHVSAGSVTSVSDLGEDAHSEAGSYRRPGQHASANSLAAARGLSPPPSVAKGVQRNWFSPDDVTGGSLDDHYQPPGTSQITRSGSGAGAVPGVLVPGRGRETQEVSPGIGGLRVLSIFSGKRSSRTTRKSFFSTRFSVAELEGDTFFVPGREPYPDNHKST